MTYELKRFNERIEAVTREQVRDAFQRRVHPDRLLTVLVGGAQDSIPAAARVEAAAHSAP